MNQRILFAYQFLSLGGVEVVLRTRLQEFIRRGIDARALFLRVYGGEKLFDDLPDRVEVCTTEVDIAVFLARFDPEWIVSIDTPAILPIARRVVPQARLAYEVHTPYPASLVILRNSEALANVSGIIVPSSSQGEVVQSLLTRTLPIRVVPNPLTENFFQPADAHPQPGRPVVAWVGRLDPLKNWRAFVELAHQVRQQMDAEFWLVGGERSPQEEQTSLEEAIRSSGLVDYFRWLPTVNYNEMPGLYRAVGQSGGCLVSTSWAESFGMTVLEAMAARCPVVVPDVIGLRDMVRHAETGWLYPPGDLRAASAQIVDLFQNADLRQTVIENAVQQARAFTPAAVVDKFLQVLTEWSAPTPPSPVGGGGQIALSSPQNTVKALRVQLVETALALSTQLLKIEGLQVQLSERDRRAGILQQSVAALQAVVAEKDQSVAALQAVVAEKEQTIQVITNSTGWALLQVLQRMRLRIAPPGSRRERVLRLGMRGLRVWRKEGMVSFLSKAIKKIWRRGLQKCVWILRRLTWGVYLLARPVARVIFPRAWRKHIGDWMHQHIGAQLNNAVMLPRDGALPQPDIHPFGLPTAYDVICFPIIEWEHRFQRPQQLATQFAQHGHRVFYLQLTFHDGGSEVEWRQVAERIFQIQLPGPTDLDRFFEPLPTELQEQCLRVLDDFCAQASIRDAICMVQLPFWTPVALGLRDRYGWKIVYDCMDEHSGLTILQPEMLQDEVKLTQGADLVLTSSQKLWDKHAGQTSRLLMLRNATDFDHFNRPANGRELDHLPRPIIGYYGAIMEWFDAELVSVAAATRPDWSFVLIGSIDTPSVEPLRRLPNVHFLGEQTYSRLPAYLQQFDVCLIPFKLTPIIQSTNPVKFYEYLSAGKPVVATLLPELLPYQEFFYPAHNAQELVSCIEQALREDNLARKTARVEWARQQTWQARYELLSRAIEDLHGH